MHELVSQARRTVARFLSDRSGATAIEYGLICGLVFLAAVGGIKTYGNAMMNMYNYINTTISAKL